MLRMDCKTLLPLFWKVEPQPHEYKTGAFYLMKLPKVIKSVSGVIETENGLVYITIKGKKYKVNNTNTEVKNG